MGFFLMVYYFFRNFFLSSKSSSAAFPSSVDMIPAWQNADALEIYLWIIEHIKQSRRIYAVLSPTQGAHHKATCREVKHCTGNSSCLWTGAFPDITDENYERNCHIFIKGCSKEDYDDFFRATGYIENTQEIGTVTSVLPVCDSDECCKTYNFYFLYI